MQGLRRAAAVCLVGGMLAACSGHAAPNASDTSADQPPAVAGPGTCRSTDALDRSVDLVYVALLARCPDAQSRVWARAAITRQGVEPTASSVATSTDGRERLSRELYVIALGRAPSPAELQAAVATLAPGTRDEALYTSLLGSPEAVTRAGSVDAWLDQLALVLQAQPFDAATHAAWADQLAHGHTPTDVAQQIAATPTARSVTARALVALPATGRVDLTSDVVPTVAALVAAGSISRARAVEVALVGQQPTRRVLLSGDSIPGEAAGYWRELMGADIATQAVAVGGFAACDAAPVTTRTAAVSRPEVVVISFVGNRGTPCIRPTPDDQVVARYGSDLRAMFRSLRLAQPGVRIVLVTPPPTDSTDQPYADRLAALFMSLAAEPANGVTVANGRRDLTAASGGYAATLPCLPDEPSAIAPQCTGPIVAGVRQNVIRSADGVHVCSGPANPDLTCASWSAGAWRFARNLADAALSAGA